MPNSVRTLRAAAEVHGRRPVRRRAIFPASAVHPAPTLGVLSRPAISGPSLSSAGETQADQTSTLPVGTLERATTCLLPA